MDIRIPKGWIEKKIEDIAPLQRGFDLLNSKINEGKYPVVFSNGVGNFHNQYKVKAPGVITGRSGTIGKVTFIESDFWPHNTTLWVTDFKGNNEKFIYYLYFKLDLLRFSTGSGVPTLNRNDVHSYKINIPVDKNEQIAIANALSDVDRLISSLEKLIAKKKNIKHGTMQKVLTGEKRIDGFNGVWNNQKMDSQVIVFSGGTPKSDNSYYYGGDIPWITSSDLNMKYIYSVEHYITELGLNNSSSKLINEGTLLLALYGATAGVVAISKIKAAINQAVLAIISEDNNTDFLFYWLDLKKDYIISTFTQGGQPNLSGAIIKALNVYMPVDIEEQTAIAQILYDMDEEIIKLNQKLVKCEDIKQGMMQELLTGKRRLI